jgi:hypothetical protein
MDDERLGPEVPLHIEINHAPVHRRVQPVLGDLSLEIPQGCST